jgi:hypothetical protein
MRGAMILVALALSATGAQANCRQALVLALDVSGSVDDREYTQQRQGLAAALTSDRVRAALLDTPDWPVHLAVFEWAGQFDQALLLDWTALSDATALDRAAATIAAPTPRPASLSTALGAAMDYAATVLRAAPADCLTRTLDISGDGKNNDWPDPRSRRGTLAGVTINALVMGADDTPIGDTRQSDVAELSAYFTAEIIAGPGAFVEVALGYDDYAAAMERKLLRELTTMVMGALQ